MTIEKWQAWANDFSKGRYKEVLYDSYPELYTLIYGEE